MNTSRLILIVLLLAVFSVVHGNWRVNTLQAELDLEVVAHAQTRAALEATVTEGQRWVVAAQATLEAAEAQQFVAEACLQREVAAQANARARDVIMAQVKPRPRTEPETKQVVDDATRKAVAARLNRIW